MLDYQVRSITAINSPLDMVLHLPMTFPRYQRLLLSIGPESPVVVVEARCDERLVGVGLATLDKPPDSPLEPPDKRSTQAERQATLLSLFVDRAHRGHGIGIRLLTTLEHELAARSAISAKVSYQSGQVGTAALECILSKRGWGVPETTLNVGIATADSIKTAPWLNLRPLHEDFALFMWATLSDAERQAIHDKQQAEPWYPDLVSPFIDEGILEPNSSIGVRHKASGEIAGWMITHRIAPHMVRFTSLFVSPPYRYFDLGNTLIVKSIKLQFDADQLTTGVWYFQPDNKATSRFTERSLRPYLTAYNQIKHSYKTLSGEYSEGTR